MSQPALTIASLLSDPRLERACRSWLKGGRYRLEDLGSLPDPVQELIERRDTFDVVLLQQGSIQPAVVEELRQQGLLLSFAGFSEADLAGTARTLIEGLS